jgi:hypothetical protein
VGVCILVEDVTSFLTLGSAPQLISE